MASGIRWEDSAVINQLRTFDARMDRAITATLAYHATRAVAYARQNASWTDRTTNARNGLFARAERNRPIYRLIVAHSVPYGVWLEVRWNGRYQILRPTVDHEGPAVMKTVSQIYGKLFGGS
jgi:hypothetical protein